MYFKSIWVNHFRRLTDVSLEPGAGLNALAGPNASGKTSLMEAIWMLTRGKSFLTPRIQEVIQHDRQCLEISACIATDHSGEVRSGLEKGRDHTRIRYNGEDIRTASEQSLRLPVHVLSPDSHRIISGTPRERRRWLDWGLFHVEREFLPVWRDYCLALRQRNTLLRTGAADAEFTGWEESIQGKGERIDRLRRDYLERLNANLPQASEAFGLGSAIRLSLEPGWNREQTLGEALSRRREADRELGYTFCGPHRADVVFETEHRKAVSRCFSRGQQKQVLLAVALVCCQAGSDAEKSVLLVDDLPAELDRKHLRLALGALASAGFQVFVSSADHTDFSGIHGSAMFHVEQGRFRRQ